MTDCCTCGGMGLEEGACPECGMNREVDNVSDKQDVSLVVSQASGKVIPKVYLGVNWNPDIFWVSRGGLKSDRLLHSVVDQMNKVHSIFMSGNLPDRSVLLLAPGCFSKMVWAYSCMQYAIKAGYSVAPLLDTQEIKRLFVLSAEKPTSKVMDIEYEEYVNSDVCFFTVVKNEFRMNSFSVVLDLIDKRARRGLITIGISRFSVYDISKWDNQKDFQKLLWTSPDENKMKMPAIISYL